MFVTTSLLTLLLAVGPNPAQQHALIESCFTGQRLSLPAGSAYKLVRTSLIWNTAIRKCFLNRQYVKSPLTAAKPRPPKARNFQSYFTLELAPAGQVKVAPLICGKHETASEIANSNLGTFRYCAKAAPDGVHVLLRAQLLEPNARGNLNINFAGPPADFPVLLRNLESES